MRCWTRERVREYRRDPPGVVRSAPGAGGRERDHRPAARTLVEQARRIAVDVAAPCMPKTSIAMPASRRRPLDALRAAGALGVLIPEDLGGPAGRRSPDVAQMCFELGRRCSATAMVFAMHQIQIATIARHLDDAPWFSDYLRQVASEQRLIASVTSEIGTGGDMGRSVAGVQRAADGSLTLEKKAPTVSYGAHAR